MKYIWRVENKKGYGCYNNWTNLSKEKINILETIYLKHSDNGIKWLLPINDIGIKREVKHNEICGFKNKKQLLQWFSKKDLKQLKICGYILKKIKVNIITAIGICQVLAER
jgi:hypothetical protein